MFKGATEYLCFAALSKIVAAVVTYPYQVVRARLQDTQCAYEGAVDCVRKTWRYEGIRGMYRGFAPALLHVVPNVCIVFPVYELMATVMGSRIASQGPVDRADDESTRVEGSKLLPVRRGGRGGGEKALEVLEE